MSVSMGVALFPDHGGTTAELLSHADIAVYRAKRTARGRAVLFQPQMRKAVDKRFQLLNPLQSCTPACPVPHPFSAPACGQAGVSHPH